MSEYRKHCVALEARVEELEKDINNLKEHLVYMYLNKASTFGEGSMLVEVAEQLRFNLVEEVKR